MKNLLILFCMLINGVLLSQSTGMAIPNTEVFLFDIETENGKTILTNPVNVSDNEGYDNQPSFLEDDYLLFASNRNGQTDIVKYYLKYGSKTWLNFTPGSEYSPIKIPGQNYVSAINLETDGSQKLFKYSLDTGESSVLIEDIVIGYQQWYDEQTLISSVLENDMLNLYKTDIRTGENIKLTENVGRSLHRIPNSEKISYISKQNPDSWKIMSLDISNGNTEIVVDALAGTEDMIWLKDGSILMGSGDKIFKNTGAAWIEWADLKLNGITKITRLAINKDETKLAMVGESNGAIIVSKDNTNTSNQGNPQNQIINSSDAAKIVQSHITPFNAGNLDGFLSVFDENVIVSEYPNNITFQGIDKMRKSYEEYFKNNTNISVNVNKRIVLNNVVIDEELATQNAETHRQVTIYTTADNKIKTATFIQNKNNNASSESIVNQQLKAYNERDIDAFMATYAADVKLYNYPTELIDEGENVVRESYAEFFERTPDLRAVVQNRIILGNKVIDEEQVTINGKIYNAVAIYEVNNGKINRVTFIR